MKAKKPKNCWKQLERLEVHPYPTIESAGLPRKWGEQLVHSLGWPPRRRDYKSHFHPLQVAAARHEELLRKKQSPYVTSWISCSKRGRANWRLVPLEASVYIRANRSIGHFGQLDQRSKTITEEISTAKAKGRFSEVVSRVGFGKERVVLTRRGKPLAAVVPVEDLERLEALDDQEDLKAGEKALREFRKSEERAVSLDEVARDLGIALPKTKG